MKISNRSIFQSLNRFFSPAYSLPCLLTVPLSCLLAVSSLCAQESGAFLKLPLSAQAGGMGDSFTAVPNDPLGVFYNPAGMALFRQQTLSIVHHIHLQDIRGNSAGFVCPLKNWAVGIAPTIFSMKEEPVYDSLGNDTGAVFGYRRTIMPMAASYRTGDWAFGLAVKYYGEEIDEQSSWTTALDAGALYRFQDWRFGFSAQNYFGRVFDYDVVKIQRFGAAYDGGKYLLAADIKREGEAGSFLGAGGEVSLADALKIRGGWRFKEEFGGLTFGMRMEFGGLGFDYAFLSCRDIGSTHKAGFSFSFGTKTAERAKPRRSLRRKRPAARTPGKTPRKTAAAGPVIKIRAGTPAAVAELEGRNVSEADASVVTGYLRAALARNGLFSVMDKNNMDAMLDEQKFQSVGCSVQECGFEMGKLLNVKVMFVGSILKLEEDYYIRVNAVDIETGKIISVYDSKAVSDAELRYECPKIVEKLLQFNSSPD